MPESGATSRHDGLLESLATCAGLYVLILCQSRGISVERLRMMREPLFDGRDIQGMRLMIQLPPGCLEAHREAKFIADEVQKHWGTSVVRPGLEVVAIPSQATEPS